MASDATKSHIFQQLFSIKILAKITIFICFNLLVYRSTALLQHSTFNFTTSWNSTVLANTAMNVVSRIFFFARVMVMVGVANISARTTFGEKTTPVLPWKLKRETRRQKRSKRVGGQRRKREKENSASTSTVSVARWCCHASTARNIIASTIHQYLYQGSQRN